MIIRVVARYVRTSPRKTRKVIDLIRGVSVVKAQIILEAIDKRPRDYIKRLLNSAIDAADKRFSMGISDLYVSSVRVDGGPMLKRFRAATMGRATMIKHRTSHIILELDKIKRQEKKLTTETPKTKVKKKKVTVSKETVKSRR